MIFALAALLAGALLPAVLRAGEPTSPGEFDVVWDTPSAGPAGSLPLGNGSTAVNAWVEPGGDLLFYVARTDSWGDNGRLLKVGRVRIRLAPAPATDAGFEQVLSLVDGTMTARFGEGEAVTTVRLWVDANHPVIEVDVAAQRAVTATASIEPWRTERTELASLEVSDVLMNRSVPAEMCAPTVVEPDTVLTGQTGRIGWYHHNVKSVGPALTAEIQGLAGFEREDPLLGRTFGAVVAAAGGERLDDVRLLSPAAESHHFSIHVFTEHPATPERWLAAVDRSIAAVEAIPAAARRAAHERWWREFWERSWIRVGSSDPDAAVVARAYALQRFVTACAGRGRYPIKFNGSLFTVPWAGKPGDADYRRWGPGYWWQNTRLPYLSLCASGDFELLEPLFRMYARDLLPLFRHRTRLYFGHAGAFIPECIYFWGDVFSETYGWTPFAERGADKLQDSGWHKWEWVSGPELVWMMLDRYEYTLDPVFARETLLPAAHEILTFFAEHYETDPAGRLLMHPSQSLETWWQCTNPLPEVAGLHAVTARLLALPDHLTTADQRAFWAALQERLPDLPTREVDGVRMLAPAQEYADKRNVENPELYAVFPFRLVAFEKENAPLGLAALAARQDRGFFGWRQDDLFMAYLGLAEDARRGLVERARNHNADSRFPAFWGPNYDWIPDQDHGGVLMKTLQAMLLQTDGRKIFLLPAWPEDWDVDFRLHAPFRTVVECVYRAGEIEKLSVTPAERRGDVITAGGG